MDNRIECLGRGGTQPHFSEYSVNFGWPYSTRHTYEFNPAFCVQKRPVSLSAHLLLGLWIG
ncbi:MAG: hypothetical protein ACK5XP_13085, partial [Sphingobacteriia bacterium]